MCRGVGCKKDGVLFASFKYFDKLYGRSNKKMDGASSACMTRHNLKRVALSKVVHYGIFLFPNAMSKQANNNEKVIASMTGVFRSDRITSASILPINNGICRYFCKCL